MRQTTSVPLEIPDLPYGEASLDQKERLEHGAKDDGEAFEAATALCMLLSRRVVVCVVVAGVLYSVDKGVVGSGHA